MEEQHKAHSEIKKQMDKVLQKRKKKGRPNETKCRNTHCIAGTVVIKGFFLCCYYYIFILSLCSC